MLRFAQMSAVLGAILTVSFAAACTQQPARMPQRSAANSPELAGAWYQVFFDTNSTEINPRGQLIVKNVAYIVANTTSRVTVIGKTDRVGAPPANVALSHRRADAVRDALIAAGVPAARIDTSWTGEGTQEVSTANDVAEPRNRVVDVTVVKQP